jgi:putative heme iron utilization protein
VATLRRRYLNAHPSAEAFVDFKDFSFFRIRPAGAHLVAGFGRIVDLKPEQFLTDMSDAGALLEAEQGAIEHMNADHRDAMNLYATKLLGAEPADWCCTGCDPDGIDMQAGPTTLRLDFPERVTGPGELREILVRLAGEARAKG